MSENEKKDPETTDTSAAEPSVAPAEESAAAPAEEPSKAPAEPKVSEPQDNSPTLPAHFEEIPKETLKRAKRTRRILWVVIIILILLLAAAGAGAVYYYLNYGESQGHVETAPAEIEQEEDVQDRGTTAPIEMPNLATMFGKTPEQVVADLGSSYTITKTEVSTAEESSDEDAAEDETASNIVAMATISYTPEEGSGSAAASQVQNIYLSLNEQGMTVEVYFVSSMSILDFPISSFDDLVQTKDSFESSLASAGVTAAAENEYTAPQSEDYTEYLDPDASVLKIKKQTFTFSGALASEQAPTRFEITYTYDYGATGVEDTPDKQPSQRMLYIKLS